MYIYIKISSQEIKKQRNVLMKKIKTKIIKEKLIFLTYRAKVRKYNIFVKLISS